MELCCVVFKQIVSRCTASHLLHVLPYTTELLVMLEMWSDRPGSCLCTFLIYINVYLSLLARVSWVYQPWNLSPWTWAYIFLSKLTFWLAQTMCCFCYCRMSTFRLRRTGTSAGSGDRGVSYPADESLKSNSCWLFLLFLVVTVTLTLMYKTKLFYSYSNHATSREISARSGEQVQPKPCH